MNTENLCIGETFIRIKKNNEIIEKRIGYNAFMYIKEYGSYISLGNHHEFYIEQYNQPIDEAYIKDGSIIKYLSFAKPTEDKKEMVKNLKEKIQELVTIRNNSESNSLEVIIENTKDKKTKWLHNYEIARNYYLKNGNLEVPFRFITINGTQYDESGIYLGSWLNTQKHKYQKGTLSSEQIELLKSIGMIFERNKDEPLRRIIVNRILNDKKWYETYKLVCIYKDYYKSLKMCIDFKTEDGINYSEEGLNLYSWIQNQKSKVKKSLLSSDKVELLKSIGIYTRTKNDLYKKMWTDTYELCKKYYEHHGNLNIPFDFKTNNGYEYSEDGIRIGEWLYRQMYRFYHDKLNDEKKALLEEIGVKFEVKTVDSKEKVRKKN